MKHISSLSLLAVCLLLLQTSVDARANRVGLIPNGSVFRCANCHVSAFGGGTLTAFGNAVVSGSGPGATTNWSSTTAAADSDGDGFSNGTELGDPDGDGNPTAGTTVTNPGDATSFPQVVNRAPVLTAIEAQSVLAGETLTFGVSGSDEDNDTLTYSVSGLPEGAIFEDETFTWVPGSDLGGTVALVVITVSDGSEEASLTMHITIENINRPVAFTYIDPDRTLVVGMAASMLMLSVEAEDPDGDAVSYAWSVNDTADAESTGTFVLMIPSGSKDETVSVTATSADGTEVTNSWTIAKMLVGDFDGSGDVGFPDFLSFVAQFGKTSADADFDPKFDLDGSGDVGFIDFLAFVPFFGLTA